MGLPLRFDERRKERLIAVSFLGALFDLSNKGREHLALSSRPSIALRASDRRPAPTKADANAHLRFGNKMQKN